MQRKHSLLVEYKQSKKANAFVDRRFGGMLRSGLCLSSYPTWESLLPGGHSGAAVRLLQPIEVTAASLAAVMHK
jgi:hypothetical protein